MAASRSQVARRTGICATTLPPTSSQPRRRWRCRRRSSSFRQLHCWTRAAIGWAIDQVAAERCGRLEITSPAPAAAPPTALLADADYTPTTLGTTAVLAARADQYPPSTDAAQLSAVLSTQLSARPLERTLPAPATGTLDGAGVGGAVQFHSSAVSAADRHIAGRVGADVVAQNDRQQPPSTSMLAMLPGDHCSHAAVSRTADCTLPGHIADVNAFGESALDSAIAGLRESLEQAACDEAAAVARDIDPPTAEVVKAVVAGDHVAVQLTRRR